MAIPITFTSDPLPADFSGSLDDFRERFLTNLRGTISDTDVLQGRVNGAMPDINIGPWFNLDSWYTWNGSTYVPASVRVGNDSFSVRLDSSPTKPRTQTFQDKDGVIALLSDIYQGRAAVALAGTAPTIDWSAANDFTQILSGNTTYKFSNVLEGQEIRVLARNTGTSYTVTWPSNVYWAGGTPSKTALKADLYIIKNIGGALLGRQVAGYP